MKETPAQLTPEERVGACGAVINEVLRRHRCFLDPRFTFAGGRINPDVVILPMPDEATQAAPTKKTTGKKARGKSAG